MDEVIKQNLEHVLVLEDDAILRTDFVEKFNETIDEIRNMHSINEPYFLFYEATHLKFIPRSKIRSKKRLYEPVMLQCAACYVVNNSYAQKLMEYVYEKKCNAPIDLFFDKLRQNGVLPIMYQCHPDLCIQGSHNGKTNITTGVCTRNRLLRSIRYRIMYYYKKYIVYNLR